jgi:branched-chain amino acid transport system permease protein
MSALLDFYSKHSRLIDQIGINAILALSLSVSLQAGQLALAQAAFMGIAAYVSAILAVQAHWPLVATILVAMLASTLVAALLALPVRRLRGVFLAIATIGFGEIVRVFANNADGLASSIAGRRVTLTGGAEGLSGIPNDATTPIIYASLALVALALVALSRTKFALAVALVREDEHAARGAGVDVGLIRTLSLALGGAIAGLAGALYAHASFFITPTDFGFAEMERILVWCVVGGVTSPLGAVLGAALLSILPEVIRFLADYREVFNGIILLAVILFAPGGLASLWRRRSAAPRGAVSARA